MIDLLEEEIKKFKKEEKNQESLEERVQEEKRKMEKEKLRNPSPLEELVKDYDQVTLKMGKEKPISPYPQEMIQEDQEQISQKKNKDGITAKQYDAIAALDFNIKECQMWNNERKRIIANIQELEERRKQVDACLCRLWREIGPVIQEVVYGKEQSKED